MQSLNDFPPIYAALAFIHFMPTLTGGTLGHSGQYQNLKIKISVIANTLLMFQIFDVKVEAITFGINVSARYSMAITSDPNGRLYLFGGSNNTGSLSAGTANSVFIAEIIRAQPHTPDFISCRTFHLCLMRRF